MKIAFQIPQMLVKLLIDKVLAKKCSHKKYRAWRQLLNTY